MKLSCGDVLQHSLTWCLHYNAIQYIDIADFCIILFKISLVEAENLKEIAFSYSLFAAFKVKSKAWIHDHKGVSFSVKLYWS